MPAAPLRRALPALLALAAAIAAIAATAAFRTAHAQDADWRRATKRAHPFADRASAPAAAARSAGTVRATRAARPAAFDGPAAVALESEPNDTSTTADSAALGDRLEGAIATPLDEDWYVLQLPAGVRLDIDVDAQVNGSGLDAVTALIAPDGRTVLAFSDDADGLDSRIRYTVGAAGRYYVAITDFAGRGDPTFTYSIRVDSLPAAPGDPVRFVAAAPGTPWGIAAGRGHLYVVERLSGRVLRVGFDGATTAVATVAGSELLAAAVDGHGDLLVTAVYPTPAVLRVSAEGVVTTFAAGVTEPTAITIGPDGDVWVADGQSLRRYDPSGALVATHAVGDWSRSLAVSPSGVVHFTNGYDGIFRLTTTGVQRVVTAEPYVESLAFDADGRMYVANGYLGTISTYDASGAPLAVEWATQHLAGPTNIAFARGADGTMQRRLFAAVVGWNAEAPYVNAIVEVDAEAIVAPGHRVGRDLLRLASGPVRAGVMGATYADTFRVAAAGTAVEWEVVRGTLPPGISLGRANGVLSGVAAASGGWAFTVRATNDTSFGVRSVQVTVTRPTVSVTDAADHLLGATQLSVDVQRFLDLQGNANGRFDVGDFRILAGATATAAQSSATPTPSTTSGARQP